MVICTIGVYGSTEDEFFNKIVSNRIDTFIDVRRRRAVRGTQYAFANSQKLQKKLNSLGIRYMHVLDLSPTNEIRHLQYAADEKAGIGKRNRQILSAAFISAYKNQILKSYSFDTLMQELVKLKTKKAVLFCVEKDAAACHRSLVAEKLQRDHHVTTEHL